MRADHFKIDPVEFEKPRKIHLWRVWVDPNTSCFQFLTCARCDFKLEAPIGVDEQIPECGVKHK